MKNNPEEIGTTYPPRGDVEVLSPLHDEIKEDLFFSNSDGRKRIVKKGVLEQITLEMTEKKIFNISLKKNDLPDISNPDLVIEIIELLNENPNARETDFSKGLKPFNRSISLSKKWGLLDEHKSLTNNGRAFLCIKSKIGRYRFLSIQLQKSPVSKAMVEWSNDQILSVKHSKVTKPFLRSKFPRMKRENLIRRANILSKLISDLTPHHPLNNIPVLDEYNTELNDNKIISEPYFETNIIDLIDKLKDGTKILRITTGFMSAQGYDMVARNLVNTNIKILLGKEDFRGRKTLSNPLDSFYDSINNGIQSRSKKGAHRRLYNELIEGSVRVRDVESKMLEYLHGKGYFGDNRWALPSSANLSRAGLERNVETGLATNDSEHVSYFREKFEGYWEVAEDITVELIEKIVESWIFEKPVNPYHAYLRGLIEIYGNLALKNIGKKYELASFQKMIVGSTIRSLMDRNAALLISPTGTGKTVMGCYIMAAMKKRFDKIIVLIPSMELEHKWKSDSLSFGMHPMVITHRKLQTELVDFRESKVGIDLEMYIDENTLIIIDEVHKFRTIGTSGHTVLNNILSGQYNGSKPGVLLLTATPIGTGFENLKSLYDLMNLEESPNSLGDLAELPAFVNVTLPFIMERFGELDKDGNTCLSFGDKNMYYATREQMIAPYNDQNDEIYDMIMDLDFKERREENSLDSFGIGIEPATIDHQNFNRIGLAQAVNSSKNAAVERVKTLIENINERRYINEEKTKGQLFELKDIIERERNDDIYDLALRLLKLNDCKTIVNVVSTKTRKYLTERLKKDLGKNVVEYIGSTVQKKLIREEFAPKANGKKIPKRQQIDILIASSGASEGHDLQDAELILNYDSWWTPLMLQQRMGRLDRPTDKPRKFKVINLVNRNIKLTELVSMDDKLRARSEKLKGIIADGAYEPNEIRDWGKADNKELGIITLTEDINEQGIELITTSRHIADLADASQKDMMLANKLCSGFVSSSAGDLHGTFVMIKNKNDIYTGFLHDDMMISYAPGDQNYEKLLSYIRSDKNTSSIECPENHLDKVEILVRKICEKHSLSEGDIKTIFSISKV